MRALKLTLLCQTSLSDTVTTQAHEGIETSDQIVTLLTEAVTTQAHEGIETTKGRERR